MEYRIDKERLFETFAVWNSFLRRKVHLVVCGGTALTLMGVKASTEDIDLKEIGYRPVSGHGWAGKEGFIFDIFKGKRIHTTELLESPLEQDNHEVVKEFSYITLSALNTYDLIASKFFRGSAVDFDDCLVLWRARRDRLDLDVLKARFRETAAYDIGEEKALRHLDHFLSLLKGEGRHGD